MISLNQAFPFWSSLTELQQDGIRDSAIIREYAANEVIRKSAGLYMVNDGSIVAYSSHESGRRREAFSAHWLESMLLTPEFLRDSSAEFLSIVARESSEICFIPFDAWYRLEEVCPEAREFSLNLLSRQMSSLTFVLYARMEQNISKRIGLFLLRHFEKGKLQEGNTIHISHEALAEQIGTTREVVTRNISVLKEKGLVETGREKLRIVDTERLRLYANEESDDKQEE